MVRTGGGTRRMAPTQTILNPFYESLRNIDDNLFNTPLRQTTERLMRKEPESLISVAEAITSRNWNGEQPGFQADKRVTNQIFPPITECCEEPLNPSAINQFALASRHIMGETVMPISALHNGDWGYIMGLVMMKRLRLYCCSAYC
ncbi:predicted protein [Coccidioides posadasii str. Silveira]|uniref:Predicted protein n=1 Tax=Coccidioides posadasii (strain RMSCC 757 / Silveira) TaxID=443226 RepID=E9D2U6_COCPS|nr:predicted protein [Coccidioides posadasii str. Silveira]